MATPRALALDAISIKKRIRKNLGDLAALAGSISDVGLLHPPVVRRENEEWVLVAGLRRVESVRLLGWTETPVTVAVSLDDIVAAERAERDENVHRKDLSPVEAVYQGKEREPVAKEDAKKAQSDAGGSEIGKRGGGSKLSLGAKNPKRKEDKRAPRAADKVAASVGMSRRSYERASTVVDLADDPSQPAHISAVASKAKADMERGGAVDTAYRRVISAVRAEESREQMAASLGSVDGRREIFHCSCADLVTHVPEGSVDAIVTDPPYGQKHLAVYVDCSTPEAWRRRSIPTPKEKP